MLNKLLFCCLFLLSLQDNSQVTIQGRTTDSKGNLPFVKITLTNQADTLLIKNTSSDSLGNFEFKTVSNGNYLLSFSMLGYQKKKLSLSISNTNLESQGLGDITLIEDLTLLKEITVTGEVASSKTENGQLKISVANNTYFRSASNLLDVFKKLPGLQVNQDGTMQMASRATPTLFVD